MYKYIILSIIIGISTGILVASSFIQEDAAPLTKQQLIKDGSPILGDINAPITILEWGDYQCTFCFKFHQSTLNSIQQEYIDSGKVNLVFKDFALNGPDSVLGAQAVHCANDQGKYWQYHNELYNNWSGEKTGWITREALNEFAKTINLDLKSFNTCLDDQRYKDKILDLRKFGQEIGVDATPSFFIFNDKSVVKIRGNQPLDVFKRTIDGL